MKWFATQAIALDWTPNTSHLVFPFLETVSEEIDLKSVWRETIIYIVRTMRDRER
jgi:hypothetical protein